MNNRVLLAALAGGVTSFLLGWLIWGILLADKMRETAARFPGLMKETEDLVLIFVSCLIGGLLMALLFSRWAGITTFMGGLMAGAWISGLIAASFDVMFMATMNMMDWNGAIVDILANVVSGAVVGGVVGWVLGYKR
ncbi:MAG: hypothetical protein ACKVU2_07065 [Saprospiraceae bacterium]